MEYIEETYCIGCGSELISTGNDPLTVESYFTCPSCNMDYTVTITDDYTIVAEIDTTDKQN